MPAVFLHGVPDTYRIWGPLTQQLSRKDVVTLRLPGFGGPIPDAFDCSKESYVQWIILQLEQMGEPVDLVGHDWGCLFTMRVASLRPHLLRSWAAGSGPVSAHYEWHPLAKIWQSPGEGERWMDEISMADLAQTLEKDGVSKDLADAEASYVDGTMKLSILKLYRSALSVGEEWEPGLTNIQTPGLVFWGERDQACPIAFASKLGQSSRARSVLALPAGHWVVVEKAAELANALEQHWNQANQ